MTSDLRSVDVDGFPSKEVSGPEFAGAGATPVAVPTKELSHREVAANPRVARGFPKCFPGYPIRRQPGKVRARSGQKGQNEHARG